MTLFDDQASATELVGRGRSASSSRAVVATAETIDSSTCSIRSLVYLFKPRVAPQMQVYRPPWSKSIAAAVILGAED